DQEAGTVGPGGFGVDEPARRLAAAAPGFTRFGVAVFRRDGLLGRAWCSSLAGGGATTWPLAVCHRELFRGDVVFAHGAHDGGDDRLAPTVPEGFGFLLQLVYFLFDFRLLQ